MILFRGKRKTNNKWVEGSYVDQNPEAYIWRPIGINNTGPWERAEVDPTTVAQFTGFTNKDGKKIFSGKITIGLIGLGSGTAEILMHEGTWKVYEKSNGYIPLFEALKRDDIVIYEFINW